MSRLIEEVKRLSRKLDDIDRRVEKIEEKQPLSDGDKTPNCSAVFSWRNGTTCELTKKEDNSLTFPVEVTIKPEFKVGDRFIPHKIRYTGGSLSWTSEMDKYDGKVLTVAHIAPDGDIQSDTNKGWYFSPSWCTKVEETKFKKGDWVRSKITENIGKVESFYSAGDYSSYMLSTVDGGKLNAPADELEPYFPKEGEYAYVLSSDSGHNYVTIFSRKENGYLYDKCSINLKTNELWDGNISPLIRIDAIIDFRPASAEEKKLLDSKLAEKGLIFDGKEVVKDNTPKIGDFCIFWDYDKGNAFCSILKKIINYCEGKYITRIGIGYRNCIKFESEEQYKNFLKQE